MKKKVLLLLLTIFTLLFVTACNKSSNGDLQNSQTNKAESNGEEANGNKETEPVPEENNAETPDEKEEAASSFPATVTDHLERTVTIEKIPERIVSGYYISSSALISLGLKDQLVGIEAKAASRPIYALAAPELLELPNVGTAKEFDLEGCIALKPDLVILPIKLKDQISTLEGMGITVIGVNPENEELLVEMITMIAKLTGAADYEELLNYYSSKANELKKVYEKVTDKPRVYLAGNSSMLSTATANMYQNDLIEAAGGINAAGDIKDTYWANISYEQLLAYNPDYIIITPEAEYAKEDVMKDSNLADLKAIKNNHIYQMPKEFEAWDSPVPSSILGKMWLTSILYPEQYSNDTFAEDAADFYNRFYDFKIDKEVLMNP